MKKLLCAFVFMVFASAAFGQHLWIEPLAGIDFMKAKVQVTGQPDSTASGTDFAFGGRAGLKMMGLLAGVQYDIINDTSSAKNVSVYLGYEFPAMFKIWGNYFLHSKIENLSDSSSGGLGAGIGYKVIGFGPMMNLYVNGEFRHVKYYDVTVLTTNIKTISNEYLINLSLPITI